MANFWDLPKHVRDRIYRLHLVQADPIDLDEFVASCEGKLGPRWGGWIINREHRGMPKLLHVSKKTEQEAAGIYFRENTFAWDTPTDSDMWKFRLWPRHLRLIRKVVINGWTDPEDYGKGYNEGFRLLKSLKGLQELTIKVDEQTALERRLSHHPTLKWHPSLGLSPQLQLQVLHFGGIHGLTSLTIPQVEFLPLTKDRRESHGESGAIPGGILDHFVKHEVTRSHRLPSYTREGPFRFLDLPPEVRNMIYSLLLVFPGVTYPTADKPTSVAYQFPLVRKVDRDNIPVPHSALAILQTNRQVHNEAVGMFYWMNDLVFSYPAHFQDFAQTLEHDRLNSVSSLTLFHKNHNEGSVSTMATTLKTLRRMRGLKKFHLLVEHHLIGNPPWWAGSRIWDRCVTRTPGIAVLFTLRGISDVKVRDLDLENRMHKLSKLETDQAGSRAETIKALVEMMKHFNHGLQLAQTGSVQRDLYEDEKWFRDVEWPALGEGGCGRSVGCRCGKRVEEELEAEEGESSSSE